MKGSSLVTCVALIGLGGFTYLLWPEAQTPASSVGLSANQSEGPAVSDIAAIALLPASSAGSPLEKGTTEEGFPSYSLKLSTEQPEILNPYESEAIKAQFMQVADQYESAMRYPADSQPIAGEAGLAKYLPPDLADVEMPFPLPGYEQPLRVALQLERYQYFYGESIPVAVSIKGGPKGGRIHAAVQLKSLNGQTFKQQTLQEDDETGLLYAVLQPGMDSLRWPKELQVLALVELEGENMSVSAPLKYNAPSAVIVQTNASSVSGAYLSIPVLIQVNEPGYYFLSGNLYSDNTGQPLIHLEAEGRLLEAFGTLNLKAHIAALKVSGDEGDYQLRDMRLIRSAEDNEQTDVAGRSLQVLYHVGGYPFSAYQNAAYEDPDAKERLAFLRNLGAIGQ